MGNVGIQEIERPRLKFLAEHPEEAPHIFKLSDGAGIDFDKHSFIEIYHNMPDDIKFSSDPTKAEGYLQIFAGATKEQVGEGLKKLLGLEGAPKWKPKNGMIIIEDAFGEEGVKIVLNDDKIGFFKSGTRLWGVTLWGARPKIDLTADNLAEMKSRITGLPKEDLSSNEHSVAENTRNILKGYGLSKDDIQDMENRMK